MEYKSLQIDKDVYDKLAALASDNGKTIKQQVREMVEFYTTHSLATRLIFDTDPDVVSKVVNSWLEQSREEMVKGLK